MDRYAGPKSASPEVWEPAMVHAMTLAQLKQGDWPVNKVIGARIHTFPMPLEKWLNAGSRLMPKDFKAVLARTTFTSLEGVRLQPRGTLATRWGTAGKWYFVKSPWGRIYAFHDKMWRSTAKEDASRWAAHLAHRGSEPQFMPSRIDENGFVMSTTSVDATRGDATGLPPPGKDWFYFDVL